LIPGKSDGKAQEEFIKYYNKLKQEKNLDESIYFVDSMHPTHNNESGYAWIKTGQDKEVLSNSGRQRISVNGAINIERMHAVATRTTATNSKTMIDLFKKIDLQCPKKGTIHIILDNARYNYSRELIDYVSKSRIKLHYLPTYSPNLNPIERLWKFMKGEVIKNKYYETFHEFKMAIKKFFQYFKKYHHRLSSLLTDNFRIVQPRLA
jgi:transposase